MRLADMKLGTQLRLGLGLIVALVAGLSVMAGVHGEQIWLQIRTLYGHPLQTSRALGALRADVLVMHRGMKDAVLATNAGETATALRDIETRRADAERQLDLLDSCYLGPTGDLEALRDDFAAWNAVREETLRLLRAGKAAEAAARTKPGGAGAAQAAVLLGHLDKVDAFARAKADQFYQAAADLNVALKRQLAAFVGLILLLTLAVAWLLLRGIQEPLGELTAAAEQFRAGELQARCGYASASELGTLSAVFNTLAETLQAEMTFRERVTQLHAVMLQELDARAFGAPLLEPLMRLTGSQVGAVYLLNEQGTEYEHHVSLGLGAAGRASFSASAREGEFGAALATREVQRVTAIPADTRFTFAAVCGEFKPREIVTVPLLLGHEVPAVLSLASVQGYGQDALRLVTELRASLASFVSFLLASRRVEALTAGLARQNGELQAQQAELAQQNAELEVQKRQLDEASRLKSAFLSNMSHELRTPLNSVIALSGVLARRLATTIPEEERSYLEVIERNGKNLLALINDVLDLSRIEAGRDEVRAGRFSVRELVGEVVDMLSPLAREKGLALENCVTADVPPLDSDRDKCRHILQNLVGNAVKFTTQGRVAVAAAVEAEGRTLALSVTDTGIGVAADKLALIFEDFRQADDSTSRMYGGTGLGLSIARRYARLLGGDVTVQSAPGKGSTFTLRLPLAAGAGAGAPPPTAGQGQRILVVEDSEPAVLQLTDILTAHGYRVEVARDGAEALQQVTRAVPDAVILDLMMPGVDGFKVLETLRAQPLTSQLPVLILTAKHVTREELSFLRGNHVHQLIQKGDVDQARLLRAVAEMVAPPPPPRRRRRPTRAGKPVVLVVEDNLDNLRTARAMLEERFVVLEAQDGREGVEQARRHQPDVVLMDIALPVLDGLQALAALRRDEALRDIPVLAVTASAMTGDRDAIMAHGFDGYLSKPIEFEVLMEMLREVLDER